MEDKTLKEFKNLLLIINPSKSEVLAPTNVANWLQFEHLLDSSRLASLNPIPTYLNYSFLPVPLPNPQNNNIPDTTYCPTIHLFASNLFSAINVLLQHLRYHNAQDLINFLFSPSIPPFHNALDITKPTKSNTLLNPIKSISFFPFKKNPSQLTTHNKPSVLPAIFTSNTPNPHDLPSIKEIPFATHNPTNPAPINQNQSNNNKSNNDTFSPCDFDLDFDIIC